MKNWRALTANTPTCSNASRCRSAWTPGPSRGSSGSRPEVHRRLLSWLGLIGGIDLQHAVVDSRSVRAGDPQLKSVIIEAAQRLRRYEPRWKRMAESMRARGKPASVAVGAIANRWVRGLFHELKEVPMAA